MHSVEERKGLVGDGVAADRDILPQISVFLMSSSVSSVGHHFPLVKPSLLRRGSSSNEVAIWHNQLTEQLVFLCAWQGCGRAGVLCAPCQDRTSSRQQVWHQGKDSNSAKEPVGQNPL